MACTSKWRNFCRRVGRTPSSAPGPQAGLRWLMFALLAIPALAAGDTLAIVDSNVKCLLGTVRNGEWITDVDRLSKGPYRIVGADGTARKVSIHGPTSAGGACEGTQAMEVSPVPQGDQPYIVIGGDWKPQPRPVTDIIAGKSRYKTALHEFLTTRGVNGAVEIRQLIRTDLDGDGTDEVIAVVRNPSFSAVLVRKLIGGKVKTLVAALEKEPREGGLSEYSVALIADLNGDGKMEIIVHGSYTQGIFTVAYELQNEVKKVLACACGG